MSNQPGFFIPRLTDKKLIGTFQSICEKHSQHIYCIQFTLATNDNVLLTKNNGLEKITENITIKELLTENSFLINRINLQLKNLHIDFTRGEFLSTPSPLFDYMGFIVTHNSSSAEFSVLTDTTPEIKIAISKSLQKELGAISHPKLLSTSLPKEYEALLSQHNSMLTRLEELNTQLIETSQTKIQNLDSEYAQKRESLDSNHTTKMDELAERYERKEQGLLESFSEKNQKLEEKQVELDNRTAKLDDRDNTHVRREIRDKMLSDVKDRIGNFGVSASTNKKRSPVFLGIVFLIVVFTLLLAESLWEGSNIYKKNMAQLEIFRNVSEQIPTLKEKTGISPETWAKVSATDIDKSELYWIWLRSSILSIGLVGSILFYIKWQNRWADHHSNSEFQLQQFYIDVNRANWVIESCLEWRKETNSGIPTVLLKSMTQNLFMSENKNLEQVIHPADELASALMGSASKLKMNIGGNELEINNPGKIKSKTING